MKVNQAGSNQVQGTEARQASQAKKAAKAGASEAAKKTVPGDIATGARAEISSKAKEAAKAKDVAMSAPETREEKIAELKRRIAEGSYKVDSKAVADKMVDEHLSSGIG